ncbi:hypothetical protein [Halomarina pelagica]|uniref:hypothetical protein n=1 Tax=Halomarina pelagica TaxID=2961599 RepID=UPI0020C1C037|nr:hypothetical protein [Halomarina sp. BND7]
MPSTDDSNRGRIVLLLCALVALAGCLGGASNGASDANGTNGSSDANRTDGANATNDSGPSTSESPAYVVEDASLAFDRHHNRSYFDPPDAEHLPHEATAVEFDRESSRVVVTGSTTGIGDRHCIAVNLTTAERTANGSLLVVVEDRTIVPEDRRGCNATATAYDYRATVEVSGDLPERVVVVHADDAEGGEFRAVVTRSEAGTVVAAEGMQ